MRFFLLAIFLALFVLAPSSSLAVQYSADEEKCIADNGLIRLQVPILGCDAAARDAKEICCTADNTQIIATKDAPNYISGIFRSGISLIAILAVGAMVLGGVMYLTSRGNPDYVSQAKTLIKNSLMSIALLIFSYTILNQIDPRLTKLNISSIENIQAIKCCQLAEKEEYYFQSKLDADKKYICNSDQDKVVSNSFCSNVAESEEEITGFGAATPDNLVEIEGDNIIDKSDSHLTSPEILAFVLHVAEDLKAQGIQAWVTSSWRSQAQQDALIAKYCPPANGLTWSDPRRSSDCVPAVALKVSAHSTGNAIDIWGAKNGVQCIAQAKCNADPSQDACRQDPCQKAVIDTMKKWQFCVLDIEAWHFEYPPVSSTCRK